MELGQKLKQARLEANLSQRQLCGDTITRNMLSQIENGSAKPSMDTLRFLAAKLGKPVSYFLEELSASPNQNVMNAARDAFDAGDFSQVLAVLSDYAAPDAIFDHEKYLLEALALLSMADASDAPLELLARAGEAGSRTPYFTPDLERRRVLLLGKFTSEKAAVAAMLPSQDDSLLLRAAAALELGDAEGCVRYLNAAEDATAPDWLLLRADAALLSAQYSDAIVFYRQIEDVFPKIIYPKLEQCCLALEDYKMAYHYACKQR